MTDTPTALALVGAGFDTIGDAGGAEWAWNHANAPELPPYWDLHPVRLAAGDWRRGWADWEMRIHESWWREPAGLGRVRWDGSPVDGTLYLWAEQGLGDTLMLLRYLPLARERCAHLVAGVQRPLVGLLRAVFPDLDIQYYLDAPPNHAAHLPMFSLPFVFETEPDTVPAPVQWRPSMALDTSFGLCWRGGDWQKIDEKRDLPDDAAVRLLRGLAPHPVRVLDRRRPNEDALDMVSRLARCQTLITTDRWLTHLAGLLGIETHLIVHRVCEWRWLRERTDSVWYPNVTVHRQAESGGWMTLVTDLTRGLV